MTTQTDPSTIQSNTDVPFSESVAVATGTQEDTPWDSVQSTASLIAILKGLGQIQTPVASFTRPANTTAYASGYLVANSTVAASVIPMSFTLAPARGKVRRARIGKSGTTVTNAQFRLHLYTASLTTIQNGDGAAWLTSTSGYLGSLSLAAAMSKVFTDGVLDIASPDAGSDLSFTGISTLYALLEARAAYVPASAEVFTITLEIDHI